MPKSPLTKTQQTHSNRTKLKRLREELGLKVDLRKVGANLSPKHKRALERHSAIASGRYGGVPLAKGQKRRKDATYYRNREIIPKLRHEKNLKRVNATTVSYYDTTRKVRVSGILFYNGHEVDETFRAYFKDRNNRIRPHEGVELLLPDGSAQGRIYYSVKELAEAAGRYAPKLLDFASPARVSFTQADLRGEELKGRVQQKLNTMKKARDEANEDFIFV